MRVYVCVCGGEGAVGEWCVWDIGCECFVLSNDESVFAWLCKTWRLLHLNWAQNKTCGFKALIIDIWIDGNRYVISS